MRLLDDKGRLFGRISVIDLVLLLVVLGLGAGYLYNRMSDNVQQIVSADTPFYVTFKGEQLRSFSVAAVSEGDILFRRYERQAMGAVARVDIAPGEDYLLKSDGTVTLAPMEDRFTVYITVACTGNISDSGFYINGHMHVAEGNEWMVQSNRLLMNSTVYRVSETPYEPEQSPAVLSHNRITLGNGLSVYVDIEMAEGRCYPLTKTEPGGGVYDVNWEGAYQVRTYAEGNNRDAYLFLSPIAVQDDKMNFNGPFSLAFDDYDGDGNPDFTLGQWGSSNGNFYRLYTVEQDGTVRTVEVTDPGGLVHMSSHAFSVPLKKVADGMFETEYYDNVEGKEVHRMYIWENGAFTPTKQSNY